MRKPIEPVYIDPAYQGNSSISDIPMHTPLTNVVYGENPNLIVNEYGQTIVNPDIPVLLHQPTPKELAQQLAQDIKDAQNNVKDTIKDIVNPKPDTPKNTTTKPVDNLIKDLKDIKSASTTTPKPKTNYVLYGLLGIGALILIMGFFKKK
jgi:hypothetical protein